MDAEALWKYTGKSRPPQARAPGPGQESVWDYPRPPAVAADSRSVEVRYDDRVIARTDRALRLLETASPPTFYLPLADVDMTALVAAPGRSFCEWKGVAAYFALAHAPGTAVAWHYPEVAGRYADLAGHIAFYPALVTCSVNGERVRAQAGGFYGGWVTDEIVGPWKGESGTGGW